MARSPSRSQRRDRTHTMPASNADQLPNGPILPRSTCNLVDKVVLNHRHAGLQLDKLSSAGEMEKQKLALVDVAHTCGDAKLLEMLINRRCAALNALRAERLLMTTRGSLTLHLSRSGALENAGIALHPVYGFVYLPGSGIKGLVRSWAETVWAPAQSDKKEAWRTIEKAFGWSPQSENHKFPQPKKGLPGWRPSEIEAPKGAASGRLVFHDAWPLSWPRLIVDVVNNHHPDYYDGKDDPGDWEDPRPVYFLAIGAGNQFDFAISDRKPDDGLLSLARGWLTDALTSEGAGAKTAAGYGRFEPVEMLSPDFAKAGFASASFDLKLVTPAFLAGASQQKDDCDLRPATLRGLLRWWWRTMHAAHLDRASLKRLETAVWGDAESGSPVRIAVNLVEGGEPRQHPDKQDRQFQQEHGLRRPQSSQRTIQGLFYASYGMAEKDRRWFRPAGSLWRVTLTARRGYFDKNKKAPAIPLSPDLLIEQANAALWLLTRFGGAGSRSRKGFGSFDDIEVQGIGSMEDCIKAATRFRDACGLGGRRGHPVDAPALEDVLTMDDVATRWEDPWYALDRTGMALQLFAKSLDSEKRIALGLPRRVGRGRNAQSLRAGQIDRHASPALWSLAKSRNGTLLVRLIAFPAARLPEKAASRTILQNLIDFARQQLEQQAGQSPRPSGRGGRGPSGTGRPDRRRSNRSAPSRPPQGSPKADLPKAHDRVKAELLEEKTKKGGWKAKHIDSGLSGPIQDAGNVPADAKPGQPVELTVASVGSKEMQFKWAEPRPPKKTSGRHSKQEPRRGSRR